MMCREEDNLNMVYLLATKDGQPTAGSVLESFEADKSSMYLVLEEAPGVERGGQDVVARSLSRGHPGNLATSMCILCNFNFDT